jgi:putative colanic acid biosynthesis UDP-glucose lipid carrier transferase
MNDPVILKNSVGVALLTLLQRVVPGVLAGACLYVVNGAYGYARNNELDLLAACTLTLLLLLPRQRRTIETPIFSRSVPLAVWAMMRWAIALGVLLAVAYATHLTDAYPRRMITTWALATVPLQIAGALVLDQLMRLVLRDPANARKTVFVGHNESSLALARHLRGNAEYCMAVDGFFDDRSAERLSVDESQGRLLGTLGDLAAYVNAQRVQVIFVALPMRHLQRVRDLLEDLRDTTASIYYVPDIFVFDLIQSRTGDINGMPVVALCETPFYGLRGVVKRLSDIVFSGCGLLVLLPFLIVIMLLVKWTSPGPGIFRQRRYGLDGREIVVYKFRTMKVSENQGPIVQASRNDARITPIGNFLRRYSIDELPQLLNVLQGRMSLVGPRPHAVAHNELYRKLIKGYMVRHKVQPGITGLAQVNGCRGETTRLEDMEERIRYDLDYLRHWSLMLDIKIMIKTVIKVFRDDRAY